MESWRQYYLIIKFPAFFKPMFYCCPFLLALALPLGFVAIVFAMAKFLRIKSVDQLRKVVNDLRAGKPVIAALFQVDTESQRHGGELVAAVLKAHGVREVFTLCGGHISPILTGCEALGIRVFDTRHEVNAVFAADAVARLRQDIGVAAVTAGPGITNSITAMKNAQMAESPLLLLGGASPVLLKGRGALQDIDQQVLLKSLCKFTARVRSVREIVPAIRKAISIAKSGAPGPVFVELPIDVLYPFKTIERETGFSKNPRGLKRLIDFVLRVYISRVFGSAWAPQELGPLPVQVPMPKAEQIDQLVAMVKRAKRPLLLMGSQAMWPPVVTAKLAKAVEALGIPVYLGGMSRGLLGANCPLQMRQNRKENLQDADLVILAGAICDFRLSYGRVLNPRSAVVTINRDRGQMLKNHRLFWRSSLAICADVATTLVQLQQQLSTSFAGEPPHQCPPEWLQQLEAKEAEKEAQNAAKALEESSGGTDGGRLNPLMLLRQLEAVLPRDVILVADGGDFVGSAAYIVRPRGPLQWLDPGAFGTLGVGAGFALGAKAVYPDRPVLIIYGDGACGFSLMEFDTFVRHKLPVVALIGNDACWSQIARDQVPWFNSDVACQLAYTNYEQVGKGLGTEGLRLDGPADESQIREKLRLALASGNSVVVNALIGKTDFRAGSISV